MKKLIAWVLTGTMALSVAGCSTSGSDLAALDKDTIITAGEYEISAAQAKVFLLNNTNIYGNGYGIDITEQSDDDTFDTYVKDATFSLLKRTAALCSIANEQGETITSSQQEEAEKLAGEYYASLSENEIEYTGITEDEVEKLYEYYILGNQIYNDIKSTVSEDVSADDAKVIKVYQIFVEDEDSVKSVEKDLKKGEKFINVALEYSEASEVSVEVDKYDIPTEAVEKVFALEEDERTDAIQTSDGYYFYYCVDNSMKAETKENKSEIYQERVEEAVDEKCDSVYSQETYSEDLEKWEKISVPKGEGISSDTFFELAV